MIDSDKWYWQDENQKVIGPFDREALRQLLATGVVRDDTMVTKVGKENWMPFARAGILSGAGVLDDDGYPSIINLNCLGCGQSLSATPDQQGMTFRCPNCNGWVVVPATVQPEIVQPTTLLDSEPGGEPYQNATPTRPSASPSQPKKALRRVVVVALVLSLVSSLGYAVRPKRRSTVSPVVIAHETRGDSASMSREPSHEPSRYDAHSKRPGLSVKGLYLGMSREDAVSAMKSLDEKHIELREQIFMDPNGGADMFNGLQILLKDKNGEHVPMGQGGIVFDSGGRAVQCFFFEEGLSDFLFNTVDLTAEEFAQRFIDSYGVPRLAPSKFMNKQCWVYSSPEGWTVRLFIDKLVQVSKNPQRKFN